MFELSLILAYNEKMNNQIINQEQAQDIFTKICTKNQWQILLSQYREDDKEYYLRPIIMDEEETKLQRKSTLISPEDFAKDVNFMEMSKTRNFRIAHVDTFRFLAGFLEHSNLNTVKNLKFFANNHENGFKKWESVLDLVGRADELPLDDIAIVLSKYQARISVKNYSVVAGDLPDLFKILNKCKAQDSEYDFHPALSDFCANHLDQILEKPTIKTFIFSKLKDIVPNNIAYYKEFLQIEGTDKNFIVEASPQYKTLHLNKDSIFKEYPLNLSSPANADSYFGVLEGAVVFLNKEKMLKKLHCNHIELFGKQQKHDNFVVTIDAKKDFPIELLKTFLIALMSEAVSLSNSLPDCHASQLKHALKDKYETIFNHAKLDMELPPKENLPPKPSKL
jgi:hypothetical protein